jgi:hypothetical protein
MLPARLAFAAISMTLPRLLAPGLLLLLLACSNEDSSPPAHEVAREREAAAALAVYEEAREANRAQLARAYGEDLLLKFPTTDAARRVRESIATVRIAAEAEREQSRIANLWVYHAVDEAEARGTVYTGFIYEAGSANVSRDQRPSLVLRRHPSWGQNVYVLDPGGSFGCGASCQVEVQFDDAAPLRLRASRPDDAPQPAMFVDEDTRFLERLREADWVELRLPRRNGDTQAFRFEVGGLDIERLGPEVRRR